MTARASRNSALVTIAIGGLVTLFTAIGFVGLLRDVVRYGCSYAASGEGRGWNCGDGIGYFLPSIFILLALAAVGIVAAFVAELAGRNAGAMLTTIAALGLIVGVFASTTGLLRSGGYGYDLQPYVEAWIAGALAADVLLAAAVVLLVAAVALARRPGSKPKIAARLGIAAAATSFVGLLLQPGLTAAVLASLAILGAAYFRGFGSGARAEVEANPS